MPPINNRLYATEFVNTFLDQQPSVLYSILTSCATLWLVRIEILMHPFVETALTLSSTYPFKNVTC
jgi:hypothetical protein